MLQGFFALTIVSLFSLYMKISWTSGAACQFTLYMALSNLGHKQGAKLNSLNTRLEDWGYQTTLSNADFYVLAGCFALVPLTILPWLRPDSVVEKRIAETPMSTSVPEGQARGREKTQARRTGAPMPDRSFPELPFEIEDFDCSP